MNIINIFVNMTPTAQTLNTLFRQRERLKDSGMTVICKKNLLFITAQLICLFCPTYATILLSQTINYIDGKVINATTSEVIPFATVCLKSNQLCVYANAEGDFKINRNPKFQSDSLIITCIGFKRYSVPFVNLTDKILNKIYLTPAIIEVGEVKVLARKKKVNSGETIVGKAIRNIRKNYPAKPYGFISYYRDYQKKDGNYINLNEAIVQTLDNGFKSESVSNKYQLLSFRKNVDFPRMSISPYYDSFVSQDLNNENKTIPNATLGDQNGNEFFVLMVHDAIRNYEAKTFYYIDTLSRNFISNHIFSKPTPVYNNNLLLYKIDFHAIPRITDKSMQMVGSIYIQPKDYSIHRLEYSGYYLLNKKDKKLMFNVDIEYGYENSINALMCLKYISFSNIFNFVDTTDNNYFRILDSYCLITDLPTLIVECNEIIDPKSVSNKDNYEVKLADKKLKISSVKAIGKRLFIRVEDENFEGKCKLNVKNIKDIDGNILNKRKTKEFYQYRELFVQEYNKVLPVDDSCYMRQLPLDKNCMSKFPENNKYWMNTPTH